MSSPPPADTTGTLCQMVCHGAGNPGDCGLNPASSSAASPGVVSSYFELTTSDFGRLTDQRWSSLLYSSPPADVRWMQDLVVR